jgi:diaminopimelate epimerase
MELEFTKMHSTGNDFMIVRWPEGVDLPDRNVVRGWADRCRGVGFDQLLVLETSEQAELAAFYRVFNADGSEVEQCGNGARCVARYLVGNKESATLTLGSLAGNVEVRLEPNGDATANLGEPNYDPLSVPLRANSESGRYQLDLENGSVEFGAVSIGNPHAVIRVDSVDTAPVGILGPELQSHSLFPEGVNVSFLEVRDEARVRLRVLERGAGETQSCGTGAAAAVAVSRLWGLVGDHVQVELTGGTLIVKWLGPGHPLWLSGSAIRVFDGRIEL